MQLDHFLNVYALLLQESKNTNTLLTFLIQLAYAGLLLHLPGMMRRLQPTHVTRFYKARRIPMGKI